MVSHHVHAFSIGSALEVHVNMGRDRGHENQRLSLPVGAARHRVGSRQLTHAPTLWWGKANGMCQVNWSAFVNGVSTQVFSVIVTTIPINLRQPQGPVVAGQPRRREPR